MPKKQAPSGSRLPAGALAILRQLLKTEPNVVGFSSTLKDEIVRGKPTGRKVIRIYTEKRMSPQKRAASRMPAQIGGVPVDLMEIGRPRSAASPAAHRKKYRPLIGGISAVSMYRGLRAGTLGCFVEDTAPPPPHQKAQWYILSNAHVLNGAPSGLETMQPSGKGSGVFVDGGDSGSLVLDDGSMVAVGLLFAGAETDRGAQRGIANKMVNVMRAFPDKRLVDHGTSWP